MKILSFDIETTGFHYPEDDIIEFGYAAYKDGKHLKTDSMLANPDKTIPQEVVELTGITNEMVASEGESVEFVRKYAKDLMQKADVLSAYNAEFDFSFFPEAPDKPVIDPYRVAMHLIDNDQVDNKKLVTLAETFGVLLQDDESPNLFSDDAEAHRAGADAKASWDVMLNMCEHFGFEYEQFMPDQIWPVNTELPDKDPLAIRYTGFPDQ